MPWRGVTVSERRQRFLEDHRLDYYSITELAERFGISRRTAHKWIARSEHDGWAGQGLGRSGRRSRRAHPGCPKTVPQGPDDIWAADDKGQFRLKNRRYCF